MFRLDALITDTLDFARNKRVELTYEPVNFSELIHNALQDHSFFDNSKNIKRIVEIDQHETFISDKTRLNIVIRNLISNALKYHNKNLDTSYLKIIVNVTDKQAELLFEDNGQGINETHLEHIFTMFYRASKKPGGSGIGLYIVKEAIDKLQGSIKIESQVNVGTKFIIVIPNHSEKK